MKKILLNLVLFTAIGSAWGQTITRTLPSSFTPPPPPNLAGIQNPGSPQFYVFQNNMLAPLAQKKNVEIGGLKEVVVFNGLNRTAPTLKDPSFSLLPRPYESSVRGFQFIQPSPLHPQ
jgi:hypothetical protein